MKYSIVPILFALTLGFSAQKAFGNDFEAQLTCQVQSASWVAANNLGLPPEQQYILNRNAEMFAWMSETTPSKLSLSYLLSGQQFAFKNTEDRMLDTGVHIWFYSPLKAEYANEVAFFENSQEDQAESLGFDHLAFEMHPSSSQPDGIGRIEVWSDQSASQNINIRILAKRHDWEASAIEFNGLIEYIHLQCYP